MKTRISNVFWIVLSIVLAGLSGVFVYYIVNANEIAINHFEPQFSVAALLFILGILLVIVFSVAEHFKTNRYWYIIPLLFILFSFMICSTMVECPICKSVS